MYFDVELPYTHRFQPVKSFTHFTFPGRCKLATYNFLLASLVSFHYNMCQNGVILASSTTSYLKQSKWQQLVLVNTFCVYGRTEMLSATCRQNNMTSAASCLRIQMVWRMSSIDSAKLYFLAVQPFESPFSVLGLSQVCPRFALYVVFTMSLWYPCYVLGLSSSLNIFLTLSLS